MSSLPDKSDFNAAQPYSADNPQKITSYEKPSKKNGWLVRNYASTADRTATLAAEPQKYRDWSPSREVRRSIVDARFDVTLPAVKWMAR